MIASFARSLPDRPKGLLFPDSAGKTDWIDLELGTVTGTPSTFIRDTTYEARVTGSTAEFRKQGSGSAWTPIVTVAGMSPNISFSFDQIMRPLVVYQLGAGLNRVARTGYLYWYDASVSSYQTVSVSNVISPLLTFDYPFDSSQSFAELSMWYIKDNNVCYRRQADRFTIEYVFAAKPVNMAVLAAVGLGRNFRLHVLLEK